MIRRSAGRWLCRLRLHRWGRVREITDLDLTSTSLLAARAGLAGIEFRIKGDRYVSMCRRPGCRVTQGQP